MTDLLEPLSDALVVQSNHPGYCDTTRICRTPAELLDAILGPFRDGLSPRVTVLKVFELKEWETGVRRDEAGR